MNAYLVEAKRTAIGRAHPDKGLFREVRADEMLAALMNGLLAGMTTGEELTENIDDIYIGCVGQHLEQGKNIARLSSLLAGLPDAVPGVTINRLCASSLQAFNFAASAIASGNADLLLAGGVEHMTRGPWVISKTSSAFGRDAQMYDSAFGWRFINPKMEELYGVDSMGITAENLVEKLNNTRLKKKKVRVFGI